MWWRRAAARIACSTAVMAAPHRVLAGVACALILSAPPEAHAGPPSFSLVFETGIPSPDDNGIVEILLGTPSLNDGGQISFRAFLTETNAGTDDDRAAYLLDGSVLKQILREGQTLPDGSPVEDILGLGGSFPPRELNELGQTLHAISRRGMNVVEAYLVGDVRGETPSLTEIVRRGDTAPGGVRTLSTLGGLLGLNDAGQVGFGSFVRHPDFPQGTTPNGIYRGDGTEITEIASEGVDPTGVALLRITGVSGLNAAGQVAVAGALPFEERDRDEIILLADGTGPYTEVVREGQLAPDGIGRFKRVGSPALGDGGQVAFRATLDLGNFVEELGLFLYEAGSLRQLAREGQPAPDGNGSFAEIGLPLVNSNGDVAFTATFSDTEDTRSEIPQHVLDAHGLFRSNANGITTIARSGDVLPGGRGIWQGSGSFGLNNAGQLVLLGRVRGALASSIYFYDDNLGLVEVVGTFDVLFGNPIAHLNAGFSERSFPPFSGPDNPAAGLNDRGEVAFQFRLHDDRAWVGLWRAADHQEVDLREQTTAQALFQGADDSVAREHIAVREEFMTRPQQYELALSLVALDSFDGTLTPLGEQTLSLAEATPLGKAPDGRPLVEVLWSTASHPSRDRAVPPGCLSSIPTFCVTIACVEVVPRGGGKRVPGSDTECVALPLLDVPPGDQTTVQAVFLDGPGIGSEYVAVPRTFWERAQKHSLVLSLKELRGPFTEIPLGEQTVRLSKTQLIDAEGPDDRVVVAIDWSTTPIEARSEIEACVQVIAHKKSGSQPVSDRDCQFLLPNLPPEEGGVTAPRAVFGSNFPSAAEQIAVRKKYFEDGANHSLVLSLEELRSSGEVVPLGEQTIRIADAIQITKKGPDGRPVVEVFWEDTDPVDLDSKFRACSEVVHHAPTGDEKVGKLECRTMLPSQTPVKRLTVPQGVGVPANSITAEGIAVRREFFDAAPDYSLFLDLEEHREDGSIVFLGEQTVRISETKLGTESGPNGRPLISVGWETQNLQSGSVIVGCAQVIRHGLFDDFVVTPLLCPTMFP